MTDQNTNGYDDEEMTVELELEDGQMVNCAVITILTVDKKIISPSCRSTRTETTRTAKCGSTSMRRTKTIQTQSLS